MEKSNGNPVLCEQVQGPVIVGRDKKTEAATDFAPGLRRMVGGHMAGCTNLVDTSRTKDLKDAGVDKDLFEVLYPDKPRWICVSRLTESALPVVGRCPVDKGGLPERNPNRNRYSKK